MVGVGTGVVGAGVELPPVGVELGEDPPVAVVLPHPARATAASARTGTRKVFIPS
jgi:hypothetical protein